MIKSLKENNVVIIKKDNIPSNILDEMKEYIENSSFLYISTFSLPDSEKDPIFNKIVTYSKSIDVQLVSNIPNGKKDDYSLKLNPLKYCLRGFKAYFNQKNHSKMVITENAVYIGSQNLVYNKSNELGVILTDKEDIQECINYFKDLKLGSVEHNTIESMDLRLSIQPIKDSILKSYNIIDENRGDEYTSELLDTKEIIMNLNIISSKLTELQEKINLYKYTSDNLLNKVLPNLTNEFTREDFNERILNVDNIDELTEIYQTENIENHTNLISDEMEMFKEIQTKVSNDSFDEIHFPIQKAWDAFFEVKKLCNLLEKY
ncbi:MULTISPECIES: hypothetical protein [unclassified Planococcus (in: firmicutes)]|uniref:hypothetical protein n=1 Tax=unclassified Planococcus (in: firmicutes) TaxID=2662419 RepID=UPI000C7979E7|nr:MULTISPECIES: hypothetical protein [unclassified Planococcus (in: firmicutes)]PKG46099.1 hypothetical protein CXF66_08795 [Planococcus sp. Urea-trap-24]PKG89912.1 hypothetical protein CXF91_05315 [Planococcus sp. Urea-3u-39]